MKVLIVEDSAAMRGLLASIVEEIDDADVFEAPGGIEALKLVAQEKFDLVLTDINMPDINGLELISFIRKNPRHLTTPIIVVSSEANSRQQAKSAELGANGYISKPFTAEELADKISAVLKEVVEK